MSAGHGDGRPWQTAGMPDEIDAPDRRGAAPPTASVRDLDLVDLREVQRRVVDPVVSMLEPGTVASAAVRLVPASGTVRWPQGPSGAEPWYVVAVLVEPDGDRTESLLGAATFEHRNALHTADDLASFVEDWFCETSQGWGRLLELDGEELRRRVEATARDDSAYTVHPADGVESPIWRAGLNVPLDRLPVDDPMLMADLRAWQTRWQHLTSDDDQDVMWSDLVAQLEPARNSLVARLRVALGDPAAVREPLRLPR